VIGAANILKYAGRIAAGALPAALLAKFGMPALGALVFLAIVVLAVICWVIASGDRTDRVSRIMLAGRGEASCLAPGTGAPSVPVPGPVTVPDAQAGRLERRSGSCQAASW
jgi:hypothetical protein